MKLATSVIVTVYYSNDSLEGTGFAAIDCIHDMNETTVRSRGQTGSANQFST